MCPFGLPTPACYVCLLAHTHVNLLQDAFIAFRRRHSSHASRYIVDVTVTYPEKEPVPAGYELLKYSVGHRPANLNAKGGYGHSSPVYLAMKVQWRCSGG